MKRRDNCKGEVIIAFLVFALNMRLQTQGLAPSRNSWYWFPYNCSTCRNHTLSGFFDHVRWKFNWWALEFFSSELYKVWANKPLCKKHNTCRKSQERKWPNAWANKIWQYLDFLFVRTISTLIITNLLSALGQQYCVSQWTSENSQSPDLLL